jgi:hypothetical protein
VTRDEIRRTALDAIAAGRVPRGGPTELAAYELLDDAPPGYWERWSREATERIRWETDRSGR